MNKKIKKFEIFNEENQTKYSYDELVGYIEDAIYHFTSNTEVEPEDSDVDGWIRDNVLKKGNKK